MIQTLESRIEALISTSIDSLGFEIVRVKFMDGRGKTLQIMIDRKDGTMITASDCAKASRQISAIMDVEDPISGEYNLEVSSPGIDRPLVRLKDFERYKGHSAKLTVNTPIDGRKNFKGTLLGTSGDTVQIQPDDSTDSVTIDFTEISNGKLLLTDALIAEHMTNS